MNKVDKLIMIIGELIPELKNYNRMSKQHGLDKILYVLEQILCRWKDSGEKIHYRCGLGYACKRKILTDADLEAGFKDANRRPICIECEEETASIDWDEMYCERE